MTTPPPQGSNPYAQQPTAPMGQQPGYPGVPPQQAAYPGAPQQAGQPGVPPQQGAYPGVPPQGAPYAPFPNQGGPAPVPPQPGPAKRGGKKALRIVGIIVVALIVAGIKFGIGWFMSETDAETTSVGSCMHNAGTESSADLKEVDCSSSEAQYKVVQKFDGSSDENKCQNVEAATISYIQSGGGHDVVLCLKETK
ncbi:LppU/SCO3897 family protein [Streptomyces sp. HUAS TT11]|uniref:LppU/SCO3897 family protein n=1 Tax=Streptomyces sp. HUAS TT11 TaxID=3447508 RepID=UPI003F65515D